MIVVPFIPAHLDGFEIQPEQVFMNRWMQDPSYIAQMSMSESYSVIISGKVVMICGAFLVHPHIANLWAILSVDAKNHLLPITKAVNVFINDMKTDRIETVVRDGFDAGHRWVKMFGFVDETPNGMEKFGIDGQNYHLYARVK